MKRILVLAAFVLTGCPASSGFGVQAVTAKGPASVIAVRSETGTLAEDSLQPVPGARVTCDGCSGKIEQDPSGRFRIGLGYSPLSGPAPIVLHVSAPDY